MLGDDFVHDPKRRIILSFRLLAKGLVDLDVNRLSAPFEFLTTAARAGGVRIQSHEILLPGWGQESRDEELLSSK
jgi:hypothetical protein